MAPPFRFSRVNARKRRISSLPVMKAARRVITYGCPRRIMKTEEPQIAAVLTPFIALRSASYAFCRAASAFSSTKMQRNSFSM